MFTYSDKVKAKQEYEKVLTEFKKSNKKLIKESETDFSIIFEEIGRKIASENTLSKYSLDYYRECVEHDDGVTFYVYVPSSGHTYSVFKTKEEIDNYIKCR